MLLKFQLNRIFSKNAETAGKTREKKNIYGKMAKEHRNACGRVMNYNISTFIFVCSVFMLFNVPIVN